MFSSLDGRLTDMDVSSCHLTIEREGSGSGETTRFSGSSKSLLRVGLPPLESELSELELEGACVDEGVSERIRRALRRRLDDLAVLSPEYLLGCFLRRRDRGGLCSPSEASPEVGVRDDMGEGTNARTVFPSPESLSSSITAGLLGALCTSENH